MRFNSIVKNITIPQSVSQENLPDISGKFLSDLQHTVVENNTHVYVGEPNKCFTPSFFWCERGLYYKRNGRPQRMNKSTYSSERITEVGTDSHVRIQRHIKNMTRKGYVYADVEEYLRTQGITDTKVTKKTENEYHCYNSTYDMKFSCDGIVYYDGNYYLLEIKTETSDKSWQRKSPDTHHIEQALCYCLCLKLNGIIFLYEDRQYCVLKAYFVPVPELDKLKVINKIDFVNRCVQNNIVPPKCNNTDLCKYCDYLKICQEEQGG